jgi:hypothetical protein
LGKSKKKEGCSFGLFYFKKKNMMMILFEAVLVGQKNNKNK